MLRFCPFSRTVFPLLIVVLFPVACHPEPDPVIRNDQEFLSTEKVRVQNDQDDCLEKKTFYRDADQDGFGNPDDSTVACSPPKGYVEDNTDCADDDPRAFPGQRQFFATPRPDGSFDFDCDGKSSIRLTARAFCEEKPETRSCSANSGWDVKPGERIPNCGEAAAWAWNECRSELVAETKEPEEDSPMAISIPSPQKRVQRCWTGRLQWPKRQLCR